MKRISVEVRAAPGQPGMLVVVASSNETVRTVTSRALPARIATQWQSEAARAIRDRVRTDAWGEMVGASFDTAAWEDMVKSSLDPDREFRWK